MFFRVLIALIAIAAVLGLVPAKASGIDCGRQPTLTCLAPHILALAQTLLKDKYRAQHVRFAQNELVSANPEVALRFYLWDDPDPAEWWDIDWIARAGRFDRALALAEKKPDTPDVSDRIRRVGGLVAIAHRLAEAGQTRRAAELLDKVEPELIPEVMGEHPIDIAAAEIWVASGQTGRAKRLFGRTTFSDLAVESSLALANKHPTLAPVLRGEAKKAAARANSSEAWLRVMKDMVERNDIEGAIEAARRGAAAEQRYPARAAAERARLLLRLSRREEAGKEIDPWRTWAARPRWSDDLPLVTGVLAQLGRDNDIEAATEMVTGYFARSGAFNKAADHLFRSAGRCALNVLKSRRLPLPCSHRPTIQSCGGNTTVRSKTLPYRGQPAVTSMVRSHWPRAFATMRSDGRCC
ncbi:hypothetical protein [Bradyrhizobium sp. 2TAF24]|uniref:hypothetical protein n=1 Tax=Bradyrhizobium sp. 2TAF24 TaxID=3233011 RepID=UPI003F8E91CB